MDYQKVIEYLEKEKLTDAEHESFEELIRSNNEINKFVLLYKQLQNLSSSYNHLSSDVISDYILLQNGMETSRPDFYALVPLVEKHLSECDKCKKEYLFLNEEYNSVDQFINNKVTADNMKSEPSGAAGWFHRYSFSNNRAVKYFAAVITVMLVGYLSLFTVSSITSDRYNDISFAEKKLSSFNTRGLESQNFQQALSVIEDGDYETGISLLNKEIKSEPEEESIFYAHYILGLTYLKVSEQSFIGLFDHFDEPDVKNAIDNLLSAIEMNQKPEFVSINYDAYYFLARSYLILDNKAESKKYLQLVIKNNGSYKKESEDILQSLEQM